MAFMEPQTVRFSAKAAAANLECAHGRAYDRCRKCLAAEAPGAGWYARLSAPGYLDATDWSGPFESEEAALADLVETFELCVACKREDAEDGSETCAACDALAATEAAPEAIRADQRHA